MDKTYDFSGWATRANLKCSDGRVIMKDAFKHNSGKKVPLVWNHAQGDPMNVLGHAFLENRNEGVYAYGVFNSTESGQAAKEYVLHGDIDSLSIYANRLKQNGNNVIHGEIREVSLVLAGANPGAFIDNIIAHGEDANEDEAIIFTGDNISLSHADNKEEDAPVENEKKVDTNKDETLEDVFNTMSEKQKTVVYAMLAEAIQNGNDDEDEDDNDDEENEEEPKMKHNIFDVDTDNQGDVLSHSEIKAVFDDAKRYGTLKESALAHGINDIDYLFPEAKSLNTPPEFIKRDTGWVGEVMRAVHHTPFSRIKSMFADITEAEARAKGYIKGKLKLDEVFGLLKRTTTPKTIYKKQKLDRDDVIDITDFDVVAWLKAEMRMMLDEEIARAILVGDGRPSGSDEKISEDNIRPIWKDEDLFTVKQEVVYPQGANADAKAKAFIQAAVRARKNYKGSGNPVLYTTEDTVTDCLLMEDTTGRVIYDSVEKLATAMRVGRIVSVPVMEGLTRVDGAKTKSLLGIIVNLNDYNVGADKGGAVSMFDDFDIDYNAQKYLIETRCSGALTKPYSAIALETEVA